MDYGEPGQLLRNYHYTHHQPQWGRTLESLSSPTPDGHLVLRRRALAAERMCTLCHFTKAACVCRKCCVCEAAVGLGTRHHCRKCWRPVCSGCWTQMRHLYLAPEKTMKLCDPCATPWALANLSKREENGLYWGLYLLRRAGEMPCLCVNPSCSTFTYLPNCYKCHSPTVMTQPHVERLVRIQADVANMTDATMILDRQMLSQRFLLVGEYAPEVVQTTFRSCFKHMEELLAFRSVSCPLQGQDILLSMVAASVSYEYNNAPNITLALSDVPYAKLLRVHTCSARYSILEAPGKVKFISFPGTHNWRTRWVDMQFSQTTVQVWSDVVEGVTADGRQLHGGRRKVWEYKIHSGFDQEAKEVGLSLQSLIDDIRNGYRLVLSGHSLGGVVAQHITLQLLNLHPELFLHTDKSCPPPLSCVTLGSPLLGNYQLVDAVVRSGWNDLFHNFVYRSDIVPRLSCGDELVWDSTAAVMERVSSAYRNVWNWFQWRSTEETTTAQPATPPPPAVEESTEDTVPNTEEKKGWAQFVPGRAVLTHKKLKEELNRRLTDGTTTQKEDMQDRDAALGRYMDSAIRTGRDVLVKEEDKAMTVEEQAQRRAEVETDMRHEGQSELTEVEAVLSSQRQRRMHRRFAPFGRFHFLEFGSAGYVSTDNSETAFAILKRGCDVETRMLDHSVSSYNRGAMIHLYTSPHRAK